jgi:hypothetical protein
LPARDAQIQKLKEAEQISKRRKLVLPQAQVGEKELEEIVKIGMDGREARSVYSPYDIGDSPLTLFTGPWWKKPEPAK